MRNISIIGILILLSSCATTDILKCAKDDQGNTLPAIRKIEYTAQVSGSFTDTSGSFKGCTIMGCGNLDLNSVHITIDRDECKLESKNQ